jgi:hypothetical protein
MLIEGLRAFSLSPDRHVGAVSCGLDGVFVGDVPLLLYACGTWSVRSTSELNDELSECYRLPVEIAIKAGALALIAGALNRNDLGMAAIVTVQMEFPDPPPLAKQIESDDEIIRRALELYRSGLLKAGWDPAKHPRRGTPPNRGWFSPIEDSSNVEESGSSPERRNISPKGWPSNRARSKALRWLDDYAGDIVQIGGRLLFRGTEIGLAITVFVTDLGLTELNRDENPDIIGKQRLIDQMITALNPPKILEELQARPTENVLGYDIHHIVEQNDYNVQKNIVEKFGAERINGPDNVVWVPRFKHEDITAYYNSKPSTGDASTFRQSIRNMDFEQERAEGLRILREYGVLK